MLIMTGKLKESTLGIWKNLTSLHIVFFSPSLLPPSTLGLHRTETGRREVYVNLRDKLTISNNIEERGSEMH